MSKFFCTYTDLPLARYDTSGTAYFPTLPSCSNPYPVVTSPRPSPFRPPPGVSQEDSVISVYDRVKESVAAGQFFPGLLLLSVELQSVSMR